MPTPRLKEQEDHCAPTTLRVITRGAGDVYPHASRQCPTALDRLVPRPCHKFETTLGSPQSGTLLNLTLTLLFVTNGSLPRKTASKRQGVLPPRLKEDSTPNFLPLAARYPPQMIMRQFVFASRQPGHLTSLPFQVSGSGSGFVH